MVIHSHDVKRASNTGRLIPQAIVGAKILVHGLKGSPAINTEDVIQSGCPVILFPGRRAAPLNLERISLLREQAKVRPLTLIVPDGNWNQTRQMMIRIPVLAHFPVIELAGPMTPHRHMRQNLFAERMSTFEAVAQVLGLLENEDITESMMGYYDRFVERMLMMRGKLKSHQMIGALSSTSMSTAQDPG